MPRESVLNSYLAGAPLRERQAESLEKQTPDWNGDGTVEERCSAEYKGAERQGGAAKTTSIDSNRRYAQSLAQMHRGSIAAERRHITPVNGRALEILGHAIEYLADEYSLSALQLGVLDSGDPRVEAVQLLILLNREVYFSNPEHEPLRRRLARWLFGAPPLPAADRPVRLDPRP